MALDLPIPVDVDNILLSVKAIRSRQPDVTPNLHPVAIRASASLLRVSASEARGCVA